MMIKNNRRALIIDSRPLLVLNPVIITPKERFTKYLRKNMPHSQMKKRK